MGLRPNLAKRKLEAGQPVLAPNLGANSIPDMETLEQLASQGLFDLAWVEMEHGPATWAELGDVSRTCDLWGITSVARVDMNDPAVISRALDRGIQGIVVPHVETRSDAERAVEATFYPPIGRRGMGAGRQSYGVANYVAHANEEVLLVLLLEDATVLEKELDTILSVPAVDVFFVGPGDLSLSLGPEYAGQSWHPEVQSRVRRAVRTIVDAGRTAGTIVNDTNVEQYLDLGVRFLRYPAAQYLRDGMRSFQDLVRHHNRSQE